MRVTVYINEIRTAIKYTVHLGPLFSLVRVNNHSFPPSLPPSVPPKSVPNIGDPETSDDTASTGELEEEINGQEKMISKDTEKTKKHRSRIIERLRAEVRPRR